MKKIYLLLLVFISACSSTQIVKYSALPKIQEGEGILLLDIKNLSDFKGSQFYESAKQIMAASAPIKFLPEQEYDLLKKGINKEYLQGNAMTDSIVSILAKETNSRYILSIEVLSSKKGGSLGSYTPLELDQYNAHYNQENETNSASLLFRLVDTKGSHTENRFQVNTHISPFIVQKEDGGEMRINPTSGSKSITKAFEKGMKQLRKGVIK